MDPDQRLEQHPQEESIEVEEEHTSEDQVLNHDMSKGDNPDDGGFIATDAGFEVLDEDDDDDCDIPDQVQSEEAAEDASIANPSSSGSNVSFYKCTMCEMNFYSEKRLMMHMSKHMGAKPFACPLCPANFTSMASLQRHRRSHKESSVDIQMHTCQECHAQFSDFQHLTEHMKIHKEMRQSCMYCGVFIGGMNSLRKHIAEEHPYIANDMKRFRIAGVPGSMMHQVGNKRFSVASISGKKPLVCRQCGRQFQTSSALHGHMKGHSKLYQWKRRRCHCGVLLSDEAEYRRHIKTSRCTPEEHLHSATHSPMPPDSPSQIPNAAAFGSGMHDGNVPLPQKSPPYLVTHFPSTSSGGVVIPQMVSQPGSMSIEDVESGGQVQRRDADNDSSVSKDTMSSATMSEQSDISPLNRVTIKTEEEWTVVDADVTHTSNPEHLAASREQSMPETSPKPIQVRVGQEVNSVRKQVQSGRNPAPATDRRRSAPVFTRNPLHFQQRMNRNMSAPEQYLGGPAVEQPAAEAPPSSNRITSRQIDVQRTTSDSSIRRSSSESPGMQISSSQPLFPAPNPLLDPSTLQHQGRDGTPWRCAYCGISFEDSLMYVIHKGCHEPSAPFKCSMCGEQCADKVTFMLHFVRGEHKKPTHV